MDDISGFQWATFALAIGGFLVSIASVISQAVMWKRTGANVRVTTKFAYLPFESGALVEALCVSATNTGRSPIQINGWGFKLDDERQVVAMQPRRWNQVTPYTLDGGHSQDWTMPFEDMTVEGMPAEWGVRAFVNLGTGKTVVGNRVTLKTNNLDRSDRVPNLYG